MGPIPFLVAVIALLVSFCAQPAVATDVSEGWVFTGTEQLTFQNKVAPTPDYAGISMFGFSDDSTNVTKGDMSWAGDSLIWIGDELDSGGDGRIVFHFDLAAIPDSAVVLDATLYLLKLGTSVTINEYPTVAIHRLLRPFDDGVTWTNRKTSPSDTAWSPAGARQAYNSRARWPNLYGATEYYVGAGRLEYNTAATSIPTYAGLPIACGADTVWSGYSQASSYQRDALFAADLSAAGRWQTGGAATDAWIPIDISHMVRMWHQGFWANFGGLITLSACDVASELMRDVYFHGALPDTVASGGPSQLTPWVVVRYLNCAWPD